MGLGQYDGLGEYCGLSIASEVFLILVVVNNNQIPSRILTYYVYIMVIPQTYVRAVATVRTDVCSVGTVWTYVCTVATVRTVWFDIHVPWHQALSKQNNLSHMFTFHI